MNFSCRPSIFLSGLALVLALGCYSSMPPNKKVSEKTVGLRSGNTCISIEYDSKPFRDGERQRSLYLYFPGESYAIAKHIETDISTSFVFVESRFTQDLMQEFDECRTKTDR